MVFRIDLDDSKELVYIAPAGIVLCGCVADGDSTRERRRQATLSCLLF